MNMENNSPPVIPPLPETNLPESSLASRMGNVFATPSEVFEEVLAAPNRLGNWLGPIILTALVSMISVFVIFSQETIVRQVQEQQQMAIDKKMSNLPKEQREQVKATVEKFTTPTLLKLGGMAGAVGGSFSWLFVCAFLLWIAGKVILRTEFGYMKTLEICGLTGMIGIIGGVITTLVIVGKGNLYITPGPALFIKDFDLANRTHMALMSCNVFTFWYLAVLALGLSKLARRPYPTALLCVAIPWLLFKAILITLKVGAA